LSGDSPELGAASAACPVGVPLDEVAAIVRRLAAGWGLGATRQAPTPIRITGSAPSRRPANPTPGAFGSGSRNAVRAYLAVVSAW